MTVNLKKYTSPQSLIRQHRFWRLAEIIPGFLTWFAFSFVLIGSFLFPVIVSNVVITYTLIWVFRTFFFSYNLSKAYYFSQRAQKINWNKLLEYLETPSKLEYLVNRKLFKLDPMILNLKNQPLEPALISRINLLKNQHQYLRPSELLHILTLVTYKESYEVLSTSIKSYIESDYDLKKVVFVLACEESDRLNAESIGLKLKNQFGSHFKNFILTFHPANLPGELKGRAGNATYSAKQIKEYLEKLNIPFKNVILSSFDADTVISPTFLSELSFKYLISLNRVEVGFQPVPFYHNNIWDVPVFNRLVAISCSFWQLSVSLRKDENKSFSSRSMSFQSIIDFDYWDAAVVQDDSRQFWTAFFVYQGRHYLENIYSPVYMDAVLSDSYLQTIKSQYKQLRRWAWGVSDFPFIVFNLLASKEISLSRKLYEITHFLESVFFWATGPILLLFAGTIPSLLNSAFKNSVLAYNLPHTMSQLLNIASIGIIVCIVITTRVIPFNSQKSLIRKVSLFFQWLLVPIVSVTLSSIPAIDAQTRLMLNHRLDFQVTQKSRKNKIDQP